VGIGIAIALAILLDLRPSQRRGLTVLLSIAGLVTLLDGFSLAVREDGRANYGRVVSGVVTRKFTSEGMFTAWVVDYRYPCRAAGSVCSGRDFVSPELWAELRSGHSVNVRQGAGETTSGRLDANPQSGTAMARTSLAFLLFALAWVADGRLSRLRPKVRSAERPLSDVQT
jgi:hypothetical protein